MNFLTGKIVQAICWTLLHSLWQGLLLAIVTGVVMVASKKAGSAVRYKMLSAIFIAFVVMAGITFYNQLQQATAVTPVTQLIQTPVQPAVSATLPAQKITAPVAATVNTPQQYLHSFVNYFNRNASLIVTIWFIIFMAQCVKILSGLVHIQRIRHYKTSAVPAFWEERITQLAARLNIKKHILLLESAIIKVPAVVGFLKPTILVPLGLLNNLSQQEVESILMHELAHIRRKDYLFNLLQCFIDIIFFFNPAVLWISSLIRSERENCCDDIAINETQNKKQFIQALVSFHKYNAGVSKLAMPFAARQNKLVDRVKRIVNNRNQTLNPAEKIVLVACMVVFGIAFVTVSNGQTDTAKKKKPQQSSSSASQAKTGGSNTANQQPKSSAQKPNATPATAADKQNKEDNTGDNITGNHNDNTGTNADDNEYGYYSDFGFNNLTVDQLIELRNSGVSHGYLKGLQAAGIKFGTLAKAIELRNSGVSLNFLSSLNTMGYKSISADEAIELANNGVSAEYIKGLNSSGYPNVPLKEAIELRNHGVNAEYLNEMRQAGFTNLPLDKFVEMRDHGVSVSYINELKKEGVTNLSAEKAIEYKDQSFDVNFLKGLREAGYSNTTVEEAMEARNHGVNITYINNLKKFGFKNLSLDKITELRDHGVTADFIEKMKAKTGNYFTPDEYVRLKDNGFDSNK